MSCRSCLLLSLLLAAGPLVAGKAPVHTYHLDWDAAAVVHPSGMVRVVALDSAGTVSGMPLLTVEPVLPTARQRLSPADTSFAAVAAAGIPGGRRGFQHPADDDGDGLADEDPLDGRDNDDDGLIDEDFAAISDLMTVVDVPAGPHLELYHWDYPHLSRVLFLDLGERQERSVSATFSLRLGGGVWRSGELSLRTRSWLPVPGVDAVAMWTAHLAGPDHRCWIGLIPLSPQVRARSTENGEQITLTGHGHLTVALAVADTPTQLLGVLAEGRTVRRGAPLRPDKPATPWIVTPPPGPLLEEQSPTACWFPGADGWVLRLTLPSDGLWVPDPGAFLLGGERCGVPKAITVLSATGEVLLRTAVETADPAASITAAASFLSLTGNGVAGATLEFLFPGEAPVDETATLQGSWPFGDGFTVTALRLPTEGEFTAAGDHPPTLSPELIDGYPNPFRERLFFRFRVPATVGEGFVWDNGRPAGLKAEDPIPYTSPLPRTTLKIYTISGREIVTLYDEPSSPGMYRAEWDGRDVTGRRVAVGTYFCKLQIDRWSVTTRVSVIR